MLVAALSLAAIVAIDVPYLPQTDALCGGAAAAMVFRYWGEGHADAQEFAVVREIPALERPEVQAVASKLGLDLARAAAAVDAMSGADLEKAATAAQQVNDQLVGGASTVVISTTTIIIILLLVIILVVALK